MNKIGRSEFVDSSRLAIWKIALPHVMEHKPIFGFGYASWFQEYRSIAAGTPAPLYDTAHNLYVQMLFEHGILGSLLIGFSLFAILLLAIKNLRKIETGLLLAAMAVATFICSTLVQEIDYVRPTYYVHAFFWGALLGLRPDMLLRSTGSAFIHKNEAGKEFELSKKLIGNVTTVLGCSFLLGSLTIAYYLPFGLYPFEGDLSRKAEKVERWMGPISRLTAFGASNTWAYQITAPQNTTFTLTKAKKACVLMLKSGSPAEVRLANRNRWAPQTAIFKFTEFIPDNSRYIAARVSYPPTIVANVETGDRLVENNEIDCKR